MAFGEGPLSHPLVVEAAETLFHPVGIRNNVEGYEREVLERYKEPVWNNPVMRFVDGKGQDVVPRRDRQWKLLDVIARMDAALRASSPPVPAWWRLLADESASGDVDVARFAMT